MEITDCVSQVVAPIVEALGMMGVAPKVLRVRSAEILVLEKAVGKRLGEIPYQNARFFEKLGRAIGYISSFGVSHGHLHAYNVVVGTRPIVIDWGLAQYMPIERSFERDSNVREMMESLEEQIALTDIVEPNLRRGYTAARQVSVPSLKTLDRAFYGRHFSAGPTVA